MDNTLDLTDIALLEEDFDKIIDGQASNDVVAGFCDELSDLSKLDNDFEKVIAYKYRAINLRYCHKTLLYNHYIAQQLKDFQRTFYCHDRFCPLCSKKIANTREQKYRAVLDKASKDYSLWHLSMTLTNCRGSVAPWLMTERLQKLKGLTENIIKMSECFKKLKRYFAGNSKIKGIDFLQYGFAGAIRSTEITFKECQEYHPHFHVILALKRDLVLSGEHLNKFSFDKYTDRIEKFSDLTVLIQKIWYLILNDCTIVKGTPIIQNGKVIEAKETVQYKKITKDLIESLYLGYSCHLREVEADDCHEAFKYTVKPEKRQIMNLAVFQDLDDALFKKHTIETYGIFRNLKIEEDDIDDSFDSFYDKLVECWNAIERPVEVSESAAHSREQIKQRKCVYTSRKRVRSFVRKAGLEDDLQIMVAVPERLKQFAQLMMDLPKSDKLVNYNYLDGGGGRKPKKASEQLLDVDCTEDIF